MLCKCTHDIGAQESLSFAPSTLSLSHFLENGVGAERVGGDDTNSQGLADQTVFCLSACGTV